MSARTDRPGAEASIEVALVELSEVLPTEAVDPDFVDTLAAGMEISGVWTHPLLLERDSLAVLDGHHRLAAAQRIGLHRIPAVRISYSSPRIQLETWRAGTEVTREEVLRRARAGELLPYKSTRHVTDFVLPQVRVPISALRAGARTDARVASAGQHPTRSMMLVPAYNRLCSRMRVRPDTAGNLEIETPETQAPHPQLRRTLQSDPAMAALLPIAPGRLVLGTSDDSPFFLKRNGLLRLPPALLGNASALSIATRWGLEALHYQSNGSLTLDAIAGVAMHGKSLLRAASAATADAILESVPGDVADELRDRKFAQPSAALLAWQHTRIEALGGRRDTAGGGYAPPCELWNCVEDLLVAGGDSRLAVDPGTGFNQYGTTPRPRPEAVHFSSSTASSISDYGFTYCDTLRRDLLAAILREGIEPRAMRARVVDAVGAELLDLLGLGDDEADVVLAPSGTDTELLAVLLALAQGGALTNVLVAPEESGRGIPDAAAGRYFDTLRAGGRAVVGTGEPAWPQAQIRTVAVPIRDGSGAPRAPDAVVDGMRTAIVAALARGERVLLHLLASSKTGLNCPSEAAVAGLAAIQPPSIDVVVDACQMRNPFATIGAWARRGWLVQLSGSKFLTGPPFSGALIVPQALRARAARAGALLDEAPAVGPKDDWPAWWRGRWCARTGEIPSFGPLFRWLPALLEAQLFNAVADRTKGDCFGRFRRALAKRLRASAWLRPIDARPIERLEPEQASLGLSSIVCFAVEVAHWDGSRRMLGEQDCRRMFRLLNLDLAGRLGRLSPLESAVASLQAHIGQPVALRSAEHPQGVGVLRMVLGARFFSIVAHAGPGSLEAALESEIADAIRALEKLELLARLWSKASQIAL